MIPMGNMEFWMQYLQRIEMESVNGLNIVHVCSDVRIYGHY